MTEIKETKIYHVETKQDYDALMVELEEKGCEWFGGHEPTYFDCFEDYGKDTCVYEANDTLSYSSLEYFKNNCSNETLIKYKAKGAEMTQEEMKRYFLNESRDVSIAIENFVIDDSTTENLLSKAKSSAKKLIEKIDDYLEILKPKFKVGDIVSSEIFIDGSGIIRLEEDLTNDFSGIKGLWYIKKDCEIKDTAFGVVNKKTRHATPEEIAEYEVALTFHKHGRKPFEVKEGDLIEYPNGQNIMICYPEFSKADFLNDGFKLIKSAEEVNEWLGAEDENRKIY